LDQKRSLVLKTVTKSVTMYGSQNSELFLTVQLRSTTKDNQWASSSRRAN
jgi:hypothetical protein